MGSRNAVVDVRMATRHPSIVRGLLLLLLLGLLLLDRLLLLMLLLLLSLLLGLLSLLLLLSRSRGRGGLVCVLLVMARLLVHPGRVRLGIELVVAVDVRGWHHPGGFGGFPSGPTVAGGGSQAARLGRWSCRLGSSAGWISCCQRILRRENSSSPCLEASQGRDGCRAAGG